MSDPSVALQVALVARLRGWSELTPLIADRVYDRPPPKAIFPHVTLGTGQTQADAYDGVDGSECAIDVHVWSRAVGFPECKQIAAAVRAAIDGAMLALDGHRLVDVLFVSTQFLVDPDALTEHAVIAFRALTEPT